ncbi:hypothetical protein Bca52824_069941 [Brassica carinata]|uniref:Uncharacterized protein n=1 Tax=Brassica carinata TaxID=52824 RepID=A0A8X7U1U8_BRACI|nr:hypothetical protein Bca52824_069941 [Brassica carinata]
MTIDSNNLSGNLPSSFAKLNKLSALSLAENQFSYGDLPPILLNLTSLSELDISNNHFKSTLPSNMSGLRNLVRFDARGNSFVGNVPTSLFTIPSLEEVSLSGNQLQGPLEFGNTSSASELNVLDLAFNNFHGPIPGSMSRLVFLFYLDLSYNKLEGQVPSVCWGIDTLALSHNSFSSFEESPQVFVSETRPYRFLTSFLDVSNNHLTGSIPSCLMDFTASDGHINLRNNNLSGFLPDIFTNATKLQSLDVSGNRLVGKLPKSLINCKSMEYLNLRRNKLKDTFPSSLRSLGSLRVLLLGSNEFYGTISSHLGFPSLRVLDVSHNSFSGTLPQDYFVNWHEMSSMWRNKTEWHDYLGEGSYYAEKTYSYWDSMEMMYKGVDTEFPRILLVFKAIDFSGNKFTGRIPESVGMLKAVIHVNFSRNAFTGSIPSSLANLTNLEALDLSHNNLSGNIPPDLANLSFVSYLDFSHNLLRGPVPRSTQFRSQKCSSFEDNPGLYGLEGICGDIHLPTSGNSQPSEEFSSEESEEVLNWIAAAVAYGPGVFCGLVIGHIFFTSETYKWFTEKFGGKHPRGIITVL